MYKKKFSLLLIVLFSVANIFCFSTEKAIQWKELTEHIYETPDDYDLKVLSGGASNSNYKLKYNGDDYFLRIAGANSSDIGASMYSEHLVLQYLAPLKIAPKSIFYNEAKQLLVTEYIKPESEEILDMHDGAVRKQAAALLHKLHTSGVMFPYVFDPYKAIAHQVELLHSLEEKMPAQFYSDANPFLLAVADIYPMHDHLVPCHLDAHEENILFDGKKHWLIDWEYSAMADPFMDLALMAASSGMDDEEMEKLLFDYSGKNSSEDFKRLHTLRIVADIRWAVWCQLQNKISTIDFPYMSWSKEYLGNALERMENSTLSSQESA